MVWWTLEVSLSGYPTNSSNLATFQYATSTGTGVGAATADTDFTAIAVGNPITIPADQLTYTIQIPILGDELDEPDESFTVTISNPQHAVLSDTAADSTITITIEDDDVPELEISNGTQITEGDNVNAEFTITADIMPANDLTVHYLPVSEGFLSPEISNKPQMTSQPLTFTEAPNDGPITTTLSIPIVSDEIAEANGTIAVTLQPPPPSPSTPASYSVDATNYTATLNVLDDDSVIPVLAITGPTENIPESAETVEFTITAYDDQAKTNSINPGRNITIQYTPENLAAANFLLVSGTAETTILNFNESDGIWTDTFSVTLDDDEIGEATGRIKVTLNDDPATTDTYTVSTGTDKSAEVTIWDDDAPELTIVAGSVVTEGQNTKATFKVISNVRPSQKIPLQYTPVATNSLVANSGTKVNSGVRVSFPLNPSTGKYEGMIEVNLINTDFLTNNGTVTVTLNDEATPTNYTVGSPASATVSVEGDSSLPIIQVADLNPTIAEDATSITIPVRLSKPVTFVSGVSWETTLGTASSNDFTESAENSGLRFDESTLQQRNVLQEITINITDDLIYEGNEMFTVSLSNPTFAVLPTTPLVITVTIVDNEPTPKVKFTDNLVTVAENVQGDNVDLTIGLDDSFPSDVTTAEDITVTYATSTGTGRGNATADVDFTAVSSGTGRIPAGQRTGTIQIPIINDILDEEPETFEVTLSNPQNAVLSETVADLSANITITDDDFAILSIAAAGTSVNESTGSANFTIESNVLPAGRFAIKYLPVSENFLPDGVSNVEQTTPQSQLLSFTSVDANDPTNTRATATLNVPLNNDDVAEANGTLMVTLQPEGQFPSNYTVDGTKNSATIDIIDNDAKIPVLALSAPAGGVAESDDEVTFTVTAYDNQAKSNSIDPGRNITIQYTPNEFSGDFLTNAVAGTEVTEELTFSQNGDTDNPWTDTFTVNLDNDNNPEATGAIRVTLDDDPGTYTTYIVSTRGDRTAEVTIWDDDRPELSLIAGSAVTEGADVKVSFKVVSNVVPKTDLTIEYTPVGSAFISGSGTTVSKTIPIADFELNSSTGQYEEVIEIDVVNDTLEEPDGQVTITLHSESPPATYYVGSSATATIPVSDDDQVPTIIIANNFASVNEDAGSVFIPINLSNPTTSTVQIDWSTSIELGSGKASSADFEEQLNKTLEFDQSTQTTSNILGGISIPITNDMLKESAEEFKVELSNARNASFGGSDTSFTITVTINDDEGIPEITFADLTPSIDESGGTLTVRANLEFATTEAVSVKYATSTTNETATGSGANADFVEVTTPALLNFPINQTYAEFTITINQDAIDEGNETFTITLSEATNANFANSATTISATATIIDDDSPTLSFKTTDFTPDEEGGNFDVVVELSRNPTNSVTFDVALTDGTAILDSDYSNPTNTEISIAAGTEREGTITIPITSDTADEGNQTFELTLSNLTGAAFASGDPITRSATLTQTITIVDDENPTLKFSETTATIAEDVTGGMANLEVSLSGTKSTPVTINYSTEAGTATATTDFTGTSSGNATIQADQATGMIRIPINNDLLDEADETFTVMITSATGAELSSTASELTITVTIADDDIPELSIFALGTGITKEGAECDCRF